MGKVEEMQEMEKDLLAMARQVEKLRSEVLNAENKAHGIFPFSIIQIPFEMSFFFSGLH